MTGDNPAHDRALVLDQLEGQWQKIAAVLLWKLSKDKHVTIGTKDFADIQRATDAGQVFMTWGHYDSFEFRWMDQKAAEKLSDHVDSLGGASRRT